MTTFKFAPVASAAFCLALGSLPGAQAAEGFQIRYNLAGSLGGEMFDQPEHAGLIGAAAVTYVKIKKVTGDGGGNFTQTTPGGTVPGFPAGLAPTYNAQAVEVAGTGSLTQYNLALGYVTTERYGGGRLIYGFNLPYGKKKQSFSASPTPPTLNFPNAGVLPPGTVPATQAQFNTGYQSMVNGLTSSESGEVSGFGDAELSAGWHFGDQRLRVLPAVTLVLPTGKYSASAGPDIGDGNFYTVRPSVQLTFQPTPQVALGGKLSMGFNSKNRDSNVRSGDWIGAEAAAAYMTSLGPVGVHMIHARQYEDDQNNLFGASRYRSTGAGVFWTTRLPVIDAFLNLQYMRTTSSQNARHGTFTQARLVKLF